METSRKKVLTLPLRLALSAAIFGILFKFQHWPYGNEIVLITSSIIAILYSIRFVLKKEKVVLDYIKLALILCWAFNYINSTFHFINVNTIFNYILLILFGFWFINEGTTYFSKNRKLKDIKDLKTGYYVAWIITIIPLMFGILFKIMHWPYGALLSTLGFLFLSIMILVDYFVTE